MNVRAALYLDFGQLTEDEVPPALKWPWNLFLEVHVYFKVDNSGSAGLIEFDDRGVKRSQVEVSRKDSEVTIWLASGIVKVSTQFAFNL